MQDLQSAARALGGEVSKGQISCPGPGHSPRDRSLRVKLDPAAADGFIVWSYSGDDAIACKDYVRERLGLEPFKPKAKANGSGPGKRALEVNYDYVDEHGELLFQVARWRPKGFSQRRPDGKGGWIPKLDDTRRVLYRLPELLEAVAKEQTIFIAEGEKDVDALGKLGVVATCNSAGAGKWRDEYSPALRGADVVIFPDKDSVGEDHLNQVARSLTGVAARIRVIRVDAKDPFDWIAAGGTVDQLWQLAEAAPEWSATSARPTARAPPKLTAPA